jgi:hypothetical protein
MSISKTLAVATVAFALLSGAALAATHFPQTPAQSAADLRNPGNSTYVPSNQ